MKHFNIYSLLIFTCTFFLISTVSFAQRNKNPYKDKSKTIAVDEKNVYDASKDKNRKELHLKDTIAAEDFSEFVAKIKEVKTPSDLSEKSNVKSFSPISMTLYNKYFNIINGLGEKVMVEPNGRNRLYLIGKLNDMPEGIIALLFYGYDGSIFQFTKLVTFDETGVPIAEQNMQYYIRGSKDGFTQEEKVTCKINEDKTVSCMTHAAEGEEKEMTVKSGVIHQVQPDGTIEEVGIVDLEAENEDDK
ncbi:hypothetical protein Fleli_1898 [Bernardetia litoralis DSM 6794]|uniref:Uncharacterized protein n=1 Tax=Bernardetia litoralis (strain ATCC 23117 / DSM 6794 / NBRC 15988 / NCIMB 1366 / Fx l1 / Sio-4) TaxID=880071 RepID=I4AK05_BERLS|nr:hypothetical protein [Bernardetia litoralis]AFM04290.1 hypothetical protein Fleli_1898 [Bernardetia litoralis DSM 6794]